MLRLPSFQYLEPTTLQEALRWKEQAGPEGMYVAGGTDLYPNMKRRHQEPRLVISLSKLDLGTIDLSEGRLRLGAGMTLTEIVKSSSVRSIFPVVSEAAAVISTPLLRNMGTLGGNLCLDTRCNYYNQTYEWRKSINFCMKKDGEICWVAPSSPRCWAVNSSDLAPVMVALDAEFSLSGPEGDRTLGADDFYRDDGIEYLTKQPDEILTGVEITHQGDSDATYHKLRRRAAFDFPVLGVAAWVAWEGTKVSDARIVLGAVGCRPKLVTEAAQALRGSTLEDAAIAEAAQAAFKPSKPMDNTDFGLSWRKEMTLTYVRRALEELRSRHQRA